MSTLRPGMISQAISNLRDAALEEMDAPPDGVREAGELKFDHEHEKPQDQPDPGLVNWVSKYPGQNSPHIGNGNGGEK